MQFVHGCGEAADLPGIHGGRSLPLILTRDGGASPDGSVIGTWRGELHAPLPLKLHLDSSGGGTADDLLHAALRMVLQYTLQDRDFSFQIPSVGPSFTGHAQLQEISGITSMCSLIGGHVGLRRNRAACNSLSPPVQAVLIPQLSGSTSGRPLRN